MPKNILKAKRFFKGSFSITMVGSSVRPFHNCRFFFTFFYVYLHIYLNFGILIPIMFLILSYFGRNGNYSVLFGHYVRYISIFHQYLYFIFNP